MAEASRDLTDDQIEQLLIAAEASLANKSSGQAVALKPKQQKLDVTATATATAAKAGDVEDGNGAVKASEELTLRVPQLKSKDKKVQSPRPP